MRSSVQIFLVLGGPKLGSVFRCALKSTEAGIISSLYLQAVVLLVQPWRPIVFAGRSHIPFTVQQEPLSLFCSPSAPVFLPSQSPALNQGF